MAVDTVTLELTGDVSLDDFSKAVVHLRGLLTELTREVAGNAEIVWVIDALERHSALTAVRGLPTNGHIDDVESVVRAYGSIGSAMQSGDRIGYSESVVREAQGIVSVLTGRVDTVRFETSETEATVDSPLGIEVPRRPRPPARVTAFGAVEGRVQTLSNRGGLRFTLYDVIHDRAVSCYFSENFDQEVMRGVWGRRAIVEGWVTRDGETGRPLTIRRVSSVVARPEGDRDDYMKARGAMAGAWLDTPPEQVIRRLRDA